MRSIRGNSTTFEWTARARGWNILGWILTERENSDHLYKRLFSNAHEPVMASWH